MGSNKIELLSEYESATQKVLLAVELMLIIAGITVEIASKSFIGQLRNSGSILGRVKKLSSSPYCPARLWRPYSLLSYGI
jgi:hypothetical protein